VRVKMASSASRSSLRFNPQPDRTRGRVSESAGYLENPHPSLLFGAYASLLNAPIEAKNSLFETEQILLLWLMPTAALLAGLFTYVGIVSSLKTIVYLRQLYEDHLKAKASGDPSSKLYPDIQGLPHLRKLALLSPAMMPIVFSITWLVVLGRLLIAWL